MENEKEPNIINTNQMTSISENIKIVRKKKNLIWLTKLKYFLLINIKNSTRGIMCKK
jgi:hypothetical protein